MIPRRDIIQWSRNYPWPNTIQVEQDLLLARAICEIFSDDYLREELVLRGGTAFHKLFLPRAYRYSEDLDFVRTTSGGIGGIMRRLSDIGRDLGFTVRTEMGRHPKVFWRYISDAGSKERIKLEINTHERSPMLPLGTRTIRVANNWFEGEQEVCTFQVEELVATKLRALYQRRKGRDLFDLWVALVVLELDPEGIAAAFSAYRPEGYSQALACANLQKKLEEHDFCCDCDALIAGGAASVGYDPQEAGELVAEKLLSLV